MFSLSYKKSEDRPFLAQVQPLGDVMQNPDAYYPLILPPSVPLLLFFSLMVLEWLAVPYTPHAFKSVFKTE